MNRVDLNEIAYIMLWCQNLKRNLTLRYLLGKVASTLW